MINNKIRGFRRIGLWPCFILILFVSAACANMGAPEGGPFDVQEPKLIKSSPQSGSKGIRPKKITLYFDEPVQLLQQSERIIVSPPQRNTPQIAAIGKNIHIQFEDTLAANTTYAIDFTNSIADYTEQNELEGFTYAFSTGSELDSMQIRGRVIAANDLEPLAAVLVGIHSSDADTAFTKTPFLRATRSGQNGYFTLKHLPKGRYKVFALKDEDADYSYSQLSEGIAYSDDWWESTAPLIKQDSSIVADSTAVAEGITHLADSLLRQDSIQLTDSIRAKQEPLLRFFVSDKKKQFLKKVSRSTAACIELSLNAAPDTLPKLKLLGNKSQKVDEWYLTQRKSPNELKYWITDSLLYNADTLRLELHYHKTDSLDRLQATIDTLKLSKPIAKEPSTSGKSVTGKSKPQLIKINIAGSNSIHNSTPFDTISISFDEPIAKLDSSLIIVERRRDSLWLAQKYSLEQDSIDRLRFRILSNWQAGIEYRVSVDSASMQSLYGKYNDKAAHTFRVQSNEDLSSLTLKLGGLADSTAIVELLSTNGDVQLSQKAKDGQVYFQYIKPGEYYLRLYLDSNNNGRWDAGEYPLKQPEWIYYNPNSFNLRKNWQQEETWTVSGDNYDQQKPVPLRKNVAKQKEKKDLNAEYERRMEQRKKKKNKKKNQD